MPEETKTPDTLVTVPETGAVVKTKDKVPPLVTSDLENLLLKGDLEGMTPEGRVRYYQHRCYEIGLDPLSRPFDYIRVPTDIKGIFKTVLFLNSDGVDQMRRMRLVSSIITKEETESGVLKVYVRARQPIIENGVVIVWREVDDFGAVPVAGIGGLNLANAHMKCITKAHRRATMALLGLGEKDLPTRDDESSSVVRINPQEIEALSNAMNNNTTAIQPLSSASADVSNEQQSKQGATNG